MSTSSSSNHKFLIDAFKEIAFIRAFEAKVLALTQTQPPLVKGSVHLCAGQEGVPVGALAALNDDDQVVCTYRGHGWAIAAGVEPYKVMAEICHREDGLNGGRAGSAYMMAPDTRFIGENSIVGAGTTIACGVAIANRKLKNDRVVIVTIGDGALNQGAVHEAMAMAAAMKLPVLFVVENNGWSELTPTSAMFTVDRLAQRARGFGFPSATVDGTDPIAVRDSIAMAASAARDGKGPSLIEFTVPRLQGHYHADLQHYRSKENQADAVSRDPLSRLKAQLIDSGILSETEADFLLAEQTDLVEALAQRALDAPAPAPDTARHHVLAEPSADASFKVRETKEMTYIQAVNTALRDILDADPSAICYGEDVGKAGGIFQAARYLQRDFGEDRVFDTPIAENAILGSAVGASLSGLKPIVEIMWSDFIFVALDQLVNQAANIRYITRGRSNASLVVRTQQGVTPGSCAQHSRSIEAILAHVPGLKVALAASATDAYALLRAAAADPDPCVILEARSLYQTKDVVHLSDSAEPVGKARLRREGQDLGIISWGTALPEALAAAELLQEDGIDVAVLDLRWLNPLDSEAVEGLVRQCNGRILIVHEAASTGGFAAELIARIHEASQDPSALRVARLTSPDVPMPAAHELQSALLPTRHRIADRVHQLLRADGGTRAISQEPRPVLNGSI
jgi:2-oxoisovalerate dehydrogenase E1 component